MPPVELPVPPSVNGLWRTVVRTTPRGKRQTFVVKAKRYDGWLHAAVLMMRLGVPVVKRYPVAVRLVIRGGRGWVRRDLAT